MHSNTWNASRAAACADEQGKFWEMHDAHLRRQDQWNGEATSNPNKILKQIGEQLVADKAKFNAVRRRREDASEDPGALPARDGRASSRARRRSSSATSRSRGS